MDWELYLERREGEDCVDSKKEMHLSKGNESRICGGEMEGSASIMMKHE